MIFDFEERPDMVKLNREYLSHQASTKEDEVIEEERRRHEECGELWNEPLVFIRYSTYADKGQINELINLSFGNKAQALENIEGRYLVYTLDDKIVAMTGLSSNTLYNNGLEIDWTCTHPDFRQKGYMQELFRELLKDVKTDVYCSCWRLEGKDKVNLQTLMNMFGFEEILKPRASFCSSYNCKCNKNQNLCVNYKDGCKCYEDLYIRRGTK